MMRERFQAVDSSNAALNDSIKYSFVLNWGHQLIAGITTFVVAIFLTPADFGLLALATMYTGLFRLVISQGLEAALVQRKDLSQAEASAVFWIILLQSILLCGLCLGGSRLWAEWYSASQLADLISALSIMLVIDGLSIVPRALLKRSLRYRKLVGRSMAMEMVGSVVGIYLAVKGHGVWALVYSQVARALTGVLLLWPASRWMPMFRFAPREALDLFRFSGLACLANLAGFFQRQADVMVMGLFFGPVAVGLVRFADRIKEFLSSVATRPISGVSLVNLSLLQDAPARLRERYLSLVELCCTLGIPLMGAAACAAGPITRAVGEQWTGSAIALSLFALMGIFQAFTICTGPLLYAQGRPKLMAGLNWMLGLANLALFCSFAPLLSNLGTDRQVSGIAGLRFLLFAALFVPANLYVMKKMLGVSLRDYAKAGRKGVLVLLTILVALIPTLVLSAEMAHPRVRMLILAMVGLAGGGIGLWFFEPNVRARIRAIRRRCPS
jgi:O-antigen/teichoic acid export membrane protein